MLRLSGGAARGQIQFTEPGTYTYVVGVAGNFRGREYEASEEIRFRITDDRHVLLDK